MNSKASIQAINRAKKVAIRFEKLSLLASSANSMGESQEEIEEAEEELSRAWKKFAKAFERATGHFPSLDTPLDQVPTTERPDFEHARSGPTYEIVVIGSPTGDLRVSDGDLIGSIAHEVGDPLARRARECGFRPHSMYVNERDETAGR